jgi:hypothetical protein
MNTQEKKELLQRAIDEGLEVEWTTDFSKNACIQIVRVVHVSGCEVWIKEETTGSRMACISDYDFRIVEPQVTAKDLVEAIDGCYIHHETDFRDTINQNWAVKTIKESEKARQLASKYKEQNPQLFSEENTTEQFEGGE